MRIIFFFFLAWNFSIAQNNFIIKGNFPQGANKEIVIKGFTMLGDYLLAKTIADNKGNFVVVYPSTYIGAALLEIKDEKSVIVFLNHENFEMEWENLEDFKTLIFKNSPENIAFSNGIAVAQSAESLLSGLNYLQSIYAQGGTNSRGKVDWINAEITFQKEVFPKFLGSLPQNSYALYYLKLRKLIQDMPITASKLIERMPLHENVFKNMDFTDENLIHSGLYTELLDSYFLLMESNGSLENVFAHANASTDALLKSLEKNPVLKQDVAEYLFRLLEKRSLFQVAEHLALAMLNAENCEMDSKHKALFEQYRKMARGNIAPDVYFKNGTKAVVKLSDINSKYKLVVFGASWCDKCQADIPKLKPYFESWKAKYNLEIVFISLDIEEEKFNAFVKDFPWLSSCELKGWDSKAASDYCVFGTPTMYLLDENLTILLKPISEKQIQSWLEMVEKY